VLLLYMHFLQPALSYKSKGCAHVVPRGLKVGSCGVGVLIACKEGGGGRQD
jgi:hypothetical protein